MDRSAGRAAGTGAAAVAAEDPERLGFVTLAQFLRQLPALAVVHDGGNGQERLRWVEPSELEDPTPYLLDGEFLLTAGLPFVGEGGSEEAVDAYVRRLVQARVGALGFGLEPYFDAVPDAVVRACRQHNLTLVAIPESLPFAALGLEFSRLLESDNAKTFRQLADTSRQLMRAVLSARPEHELLAALVQRVPVWAVLVGADGRVRARGSGPSPGPQAAGAAAGTVPGVDSADLQPLLARLLAGSGPRVEMDSFDAAGSSLVFGYPLRSTRDANLGALVLGTDAPLTPAQNSVVSTAVGLLELLVRQRISGSLAPSQLATALLLHPESVASGSARHVNGFKDLLAQSISSTRSGQLRVVQGLRIDAAPDSARTPGGRGTGRGSGAGAAGVAAAVRHQTGGAHRVRLCRHHPVKGRRRPARRSGAARLAPGDRQRHRFREPAGGLPARRFTAQPRSHEPPERPGGRRDVVGGRPAGTGCRHPAGGPSAGAPARPRAGAPRQPARHPAGLAGRKRKLGRHGKGHGTASKQRPPADRHHR